MDNILSYKLVGLCEEKENYKLYWDNLNLKIENDIYHNF